MINSKFDMYKSDQYNTFQLGKVAKVFKTKKGAFIDLVSTLGKDKKEFTTRGIFINANDGSVNEGDRVFVALAKTGTTPAVDKEGKPVMSKNDPSKQIMNQNYFTIVFVNENDNGQEFDFSGLNTETK